MRKSICWKTEFTAGQYTSVSGLQHDGPITISYDGRAITIIGMTQETDILVTDVAGRVEYRATATGTRRIDPSAKGIHIVRAGGVTKKIMTY